MTNFYDLIDTYAEYMGIDKTEVLHLWYRGSINAEDLISAYLENEGIYGYGQELISIIRTLKHQSARDGKPDPWQLET